MRRHTLLSIVTTLALVAAPASVGLAQRTPPPRLADPADDVEDEELEDEEEWDEEEEEWDEEELDEEELDEEEFDEEELDPGPLDEEEEAVPTTEGDPLDEPAPGDDQSLLDGAAPSSDPTRAAWTSPQSVLSLHGYLRVRGELMDNFFLDHRNQWPFSLWVPGGSEAIVTGDCREGVEACNRGDRIRGANMRVRLQPTLALSDDVRVHMTIDVLDNVALGSSPDRVLDGAPPTGSDAPDGDMIDFGSGGVSSTSTGDAFRDSIYVRRAWAEVTNRALGQLRFGRMAHEWGLGMLYNAGDGLDDDYSSEIDRIQAITRYSDLFFGASYDFAGEGVIMSPITRLRAVPFDFTGADDIRQFSFLAAYRLSEEEQEERLANGDWVLNAGIYFLYRTQRLSSEAIQPTDEDELTPGAPLVGLVRRDARQATPDIWAQFLWGDLRLELEAALNVGRIGNIAVDGYEDDDYRILSFGFAFQGEYRLLDDALGIYVDTGLGTGDSQVRGISGRENTYLQQDDNSQLTHFGFHPNYRIDLILFRNILGNVGGVWYLRPGLSYDIVRTAFGQRLGARVDFIYSRANRNSQIREYGDRGANTLGLELNASVYYRSEDGPGLTDGFYAAFHYGILFPMAGLRETGLGVGKAQTLRLVLGVEY